MSNQYEPRVWKCKSCHFVLGIILCDSDNLPKLNVLRKAIPLTELCELGDVRNQSSGIYAVINVGSCRVGCGQCGAKRKWNLSKAQETVLDEQFEDLSKKQWEAAYV
jgi:hypothetical protein